MYFDVLDPSSITKFLASKHVGQSVNPKELIREWPFIDSGVAKRLVTQGMRYAPTAKNPKSILQAQKWVFPYEHEYFHFKFPAWGPAMLPIYPSAVQVSIGIILECVSPFLQDTLPINYIVEKYVEDLQASFKKIFCGNRDERLDIDLQKNKTLKTLLESEYEDEDDLWKCVFRTCQIMLRNNSTAPDPVNVDDDYELALFLGFRHPVEIAYIFADITHLTPLSKLHRWFSVQSRGPYTASPVLPTLATFRNDWNVLRESFENPAWEHDQVFSLSATIDDVGNMQNPSTFADALTVEAEKKFGRNLWYHATSQSSARSICTDGILLRLCRLQTDFGDNVFYLGNKLGRAIDWCLRAKGDWNLDRVENPTPCILIFSSDVEKLIKDELIHPQNDKKRWQRIIQLHRVGQEPRDRDERKIVNSKETLRGWVAKKPKRNKAPGWIDKNFHQIGFRKPEAIDPLPEHIQGRIDFAPSY